MSEREKFEKWLQRYDPDQSLTLAADFPHYASYVTCMIAAAWQAALSTRKPYGYGIVDKDWDVITVTPGNDKDSMIALTSRWNAIQEQVPGYPFKTVTLFYEDSES